MRTSTLLLILISPAALWAAPGVYSFAHGDIGLAEGPNLSFHWHMHPTAVVDGSPLGIDTEYEPDELIALVPNSSFLRSQTLGGRPAGSQWDFLGISAGTPYWFLSQSNTGLSGANTLGAPFLGLGSEDATFTEDITFSLTAKTGPGHFALFQLGTPDVYFATSDGITGTDSLIVTPPSHDHFVFAFTQPGFYELTFGVSAIIGGLPQSDSATYGFNVVPEPSTYAILAGLGVLGAALMRRRIRS